MKINDLNNLTLQELNANEIKIITGGSEEAVLFSFVLTGVLDGIKHNTECHLTLFGKRIF
ncbi:hypothetical protein [Aquirufa nivalisilvae]|uniref:hypothetical protein n=1 Tax=Aquirufa nivalisilvae TaxID=2516557 RepID=UPI001032AAC7|nr:hypothetical protein [Aquirufa nivalisilvae]TBH76571.1 hypothetical protein EWU22_03270 [Aquirufa nivalisilvae]